MIVAGFQGVDEHYNITTLGRGGSDTTAVALAAVSAPTAARSTRTSTAFTPPTRGSFPRPARSTGSATTRCSSWPAWARA